MSSPSRCSRTGRVIVGGYFLNIGGAARSRIARLSATTGSADSFDPNANGIVFIVAIQPDGKILAGGTFQGFQGAISIGGKSRNRIARLDGITGLADSFNPDADDEVYALAVLPSGKILMGGIFRTVSGQMHDSIARLDASTGLADSFNPNVLAGSVSTIAAQTDGKILIGGGFSSINGSRRFLIARLDGVTGSLDSFNPDPLGASSGPAPSVDEIVIQPDGRILVSGLFARIGDQARNNMARLDPITGLADSFDPNANDYVEAIALQPDGKIVVGGSFTTLAPNGGPTITRNRIARLIPSGGLGKHFDTWVRANGRQRYDRRFYYYRPDRFDQNGSYPWIGPLAQSKRSADNRAGWPIPPSN